MDVLNKFELDSLGVGMELKTHDPSQHQEVQEDQDPASAEPRPLALFRIEDQA